MKDIFIDNNVAKNFANPLDPEYNKLVAWLMYDQTAFLVTCQKLIIEYGRTSAASNSNTCIWAILDIVTKEGRKNHIKKESIETFKQKFFKKRIVNKFTCTSNDREFIPVVLLSFRKYALVRDKAFKKDIECFPGFTAHAEKKPQDLPYQ